MSNPRNSIFLSVLPAVEKSPTTAQAAQPSAQQPTGSALLDSFVTEAAQSALAQQAALTEELTQLGYELKRIAHIKTISLRQSSQESPSDTRQPSAADLRKAQAPTARRAAVPIEGLAKSPIESLKNQPVERGSESGRAVGLAVNQATEAPAFTQATPEARVYGGSSYKVLQAKAALGGLVNLDDSLLFGGANSSPSSRGLGAKPLQTEADFSSYLNNQIEDFTASPIGGGIHFTAHLSESTGSEDGGSRNSPTDNPYQTVLDIKTFKLSDLTAEDSAYLESADSSTTDRNVDRDDSVAEEMAGLGDLGKQVTYLNQKIEHLSQKLAELMAVSPTSYVLSSSLNSFPI